MDDLAHFFCDCPNTALFWKGIHEWVDKVEDTYIVSISTRDRLLGVPLGFPKGKRINLITLAAKYYIHRQKLFENGNLSVLHWLQEFRARLRVDRWVSTRLGRSETFAPWERYLKALG